LSINIEIRKPNFAPYQVEFLYGPERFCVTEASTKCGKTFAHIFWIYEQAHLPERKNNDNVWWVAPTYSQSKIAFSRLRNNIRASGLYKINESNLTILCPNGVYIWFKSADNPDTLFGEDVYALVFDEAPRAKVEAWYALRSTITATKGKAKLIGNFGGVSNWMHVLKEKALTDPEYSYHKITAWDAVDAGILDRAEVEQAQKDLPIKIFKQLYLAEQDESENQLCSFEKISDLWTNSFVVRGERYISADIAMLGSDKFVMFVWEGLRIIDCIVIEKCDGAAVEKIIKTIAEKYKVGRSNIVYDADGLGGYLSGYLSGAVAFHNGGKPISDANYKNLKTQCGYKLAQKINTNEIFIDCDISKEVIVRELECLQSDMLDSDGKICLLSKKKIKELIKNSPDYLDALTMRMVFEIKPAFFVF
jgi:hypothetical protein